MARTSGKHNPDGCGTTGRIPTLHVVAESIPQAHYRAMKAVWEHGLAIRTEYDRKEGGKYIDPPSRDARVLVEITDPFAQPRYPPVSFCEIGTYIAEIMGAKDHLVLPIATLKEAIGGELSAHQWPYTYHQRLVAHPDLGGSIVNQIDLAVERVAKTPYTRRAIATTSVPNLDPFLKEDVPCLREVQLRCPENAAGNLLLNVSTAWRSRDLFKAWPDNVVGLTFFFQVLARQIAAKTGRPVKVGRREGHAGAAATAGAAHPAAGQAVALPEISARAAAGADRGHRVGQVHGLTRDGAVKSTDEQATARPWHHERIGIYCTPSICLTAGRIASAQTS
ncbi:MAG: hypothetical protein NTW87_28765 [Planctomycetota bacterium]|nr:hypothetical protein [Planctomycetota bacterium]